LLGFIRLDSELATVTPEMKSSAELKGFAPDLRMPMQRQGFPLEMASPMVFTCAYRFIDRGLKPANMLPGWTWQAGISNFELSMQAEASAPGAR
jgi:hypothetical protein